MSSHPNAILQLTLTPDDLPSKTFREIKADSEYDEGDDQFKIGGEDYHCALMDDTYDDNWQVSAKEGDIVLLDMVTYGYGESIPWDKLAAQKDVLEAWAKEKCEKHKCSYQISVTANHW